jgi:hypothetical protein
MVGIAIVRYRINGQYVDLIPFNLILKAIPVNLDYINKMIRRKTIPPSMFVTPTKSKKLNTLLTVEHATLIIEWLHRITCNFTKNVRWTNDELNAFHVEWAKINDAYCKKLGLPLEYGLEFVTKDRKEYVTKRAIAIDAHLIKYYTKKGVDLEKLKEDIKSDYKRRYELFSKFDEDSIDEAFKFIEREEIESQSKPTGKRNKKGEK